EVSGLRYGQEIPQVTHFNRIMHRRLLEYWGGSRVEAEGGSEGGTSLPHSGITIERRRQLPFCLAPAMVALILALAGVARWARSLRISTLRFAPWPTPKSTATRPTPVFQQSLKRAQSFVPYPCSRTLTLHVNMKRDYRGRQRPAHATLDCASRARVTRGSAVNSLDRESFRSLDRPLLTVSYYPLLLA